MRILAVRVGRVGDMVMITPALGAVIEHFPQAEITLLTSIDGRRLLRGFSPRITDVWVWDRSSLFSFLEKRRLKVRIADAGFDAIFCFEFKDTFFDLFPAAGPPVYGYTRASHTTHFARHCLDVIASALGHPLPDRPLHLPVRPGMRKRVDEELRAVGIGPDDIVVGLHPTYSGYGRLSARKERTKHRLWPETRFAELGRRIAAIELRGGAKPRVIVDLLPKELALGERMRSMSEGAITLLAPEPNMERYKALLQRIDLFITPNTGPMHIAAAVGTREVVLFSGLIPEDCAPFVDPDSFTVIRAEDTPDTELGLAAIEVDTVFNACVDQLRRLPKPARSR